MRRALAIVGLVLAIGGFVLIPLSLLFNITFIVPVGMIFAAFLILLKVKAMPSDLDDDTEGGVIDVPADDDNGGRDRNEQ